MARSRVVTREPAKSAQVEPEMSSDDETAILESLAEDRGHAPSEFVPEQREGKPPRSRVGVELDRLRLMLKTLSTWRNPTPFRPQQLSQADVAEAMGTTQSAVARIESGLADPQFTTLVRYAAACGYRLTIHLDPMTDAGPALTAVGSTEAMASTFPITHSRTGVSVPFTEDDVRQILVIVERTEEPVELRTELARALTGIATLGYRLGQPGHYDPNVPVAESERTTAPPAIRAAPASRT